MKAKPPHHVILDKDFAGIPKGSKLHISCPVEVAEELKSITPGSIMAIQAFMGRVQPNRQYKKSRAILAGCGVKFTHGKETEF
jgi:hypothetical protein